MNKKASIQDLMLTMVIIFFAAILFFTTTHMYIKFVDKAVNTTAINSSQAAVDSFNKTKDLTSRLDYVIFALLMGMTLGIVITAWLVKAHPIFTFIWFIAMVVLVALSAIFSFVWEKISTKPIFGNLVTETFPITDFILTNFPVYITIVGFVGMMVMFAKPREGR